MLNVAQLAIVDRDAQGASSALGAAQRAMRHNTIFPRQIVGFITLTGDLRKLRGDLAGAEAAYRDAIKVEPLIPTTHLSLAQTLAMEGKADEASAAAERGLALLAPDARAKHRRQFEKLLAIPKAKERSAAPATGN